MESFVPKSLHWSHTWTSPRHFLVFNYSQSPDIGICIIISPSKQIIEPNYALNANHVVDLRGFWCWSDFWRSLTADILAEWDGNPACNAFQKFFVTSKGFMLYSHYWLHIICEKGKESTGSLFAKSGIAALSDWNPWRVKPWPDIITVQDPSPLEAKFVFRSFWQIQMLS